MSKLTIVVPAYNEAAVIEKKLHDLYQTDLPHDRFQVIVGSDGSTDGTADEARAFRDRNACVNLEILEFPNRGKAATLNDMIVHSRHDILLSTDADAIFADRGLLGRILARFESEPGLGGISCDPVFKTNAVELRYWKTERSVRQFLSERRCLFVVTGMGFAFRKTSVDAIPPGIMADDLWMPLSILKNGYTVVSDREFRASTDIFSDERELKRKIRVVKGGMQCITAFFAANPRMLATPVFLWVLVFKVGKWMLPLLVTAALLLVAAVEWRAALAVVAAGGVAVLVSKHIRYLVGGIFVPVAAMFEMLSRRDMARWGHVR